MKKIPAFDYALAEKLHREAASRYHNNWFKLGFKKNCRFQYLRGY